jgi:hypothetical protein
MKQFTIKGLKDLLNEDEYYKSLSRESSRLLYYDKCNWFISETYSTSLGNEDEVNLFQNLHSDNLKKVLGNRYYKQVISTLESLGIILINDKYSANNFSKSYAISDRAFETGIVKVKIQSKAFLKTYHSYCQYKYNEVENNVVLKKIIGNISKLYLINNPANYMAKILPKVSAPKPVVNTDLLNLWFEEINMKRFNRYSTYFDSFIELNKHTDPFEVYKLPVFFKPKEAASGRIYHLITSVPKYIRECFITKENEDIYEVDMASAQPSILFLEWMRQLKPKESLSEAEINEFKLCRELFVSGGIYNYIKENSGYYGRFKSKEEYAKLKKEILTSLNGKDSAAPCIVALKELFPNFMKWVTGIKKDKGHKYVSHIGQSAEAKIFVEVYKRIPEGIFSLIIHDCILTTEENTLLVRKLLIERLKELYGDIIPQGDNLDKLFKIDKVSKTLQEIFSEE